MKEGDIVGVYGGGVILGTIERVYEKNAIVRLFSSPGKKVDVFIGKEEIPTEAEGMGGGNFTVIIPKGIEVYKEDAVRFKIDTINLLGTVESVSATASDAFQTVVFQTPVNIYTLKWVEVFLGNVDVNTVIEE